MPVMERAHGRHQRNRGFSLAQIVECVAAGNVRAVRGLRDIGTLDGWGWGAAADHRTKANLNKRRAWTTRVLGQQKICAACSRCAT
jgi:hypothetical protein